ncbi:MAG: hypothetical protein MUE41_07770, partial [Gemmatimonadaceae bacterium]|nr:hypothetical protein [Gemmatimonadaceae bacterium]
PAAVAVDATLADSTRSSLYVALDDLERRVLPALDHDAAQTIGRALRTLRTAIARGDLPAARAASAMMHSTAATLADAGHSALTVDLAVVDLVTAAVEAELTPARRGVR